MGWGTSNVIVTKSNIDSSALAAGYTYKLAPSPSWSGNSECITAGDARTYICCDISQFSGHDANRLLAYQYLARTYSWSLRYSATSYANACTQGYTTVFSTSSSLSSGIQLYITNCQCDTGANAGYYLDSSGNAYQFSSHTGLVPDGTYSCASYNHYLVYYKTCGADCSTITNQQQNISTTSTLTTGKFYEDGTNVYQVQGSGSSGGPIITIMSGPYDTCAAVLCSS